MDLTKLVFCFDPLVAVTIVALHCFEAVQLPGAGAGVLVELKELMGSVDRGVREVVVRGRRGVLGVAISEDSKFSCPRTDFLGIK